MQRQGDPADRYVEIVFLILLTQESKLKSLLTQLEKTLKFNIRIRYCELMGRSVRKLSDQKDPVKSHKEEGCFTGKIMEYKRRTENIMLGSRDSKRLSESEDKMPLASIRTLISSEWKLTQ